MLLAGLHGHTGWGRAVHTQLLRYFVVEQHKHMWAWQGGRTHPAELHASDRPAAAHSVGQDSLDRCPKLLQLSHTDILVLMLQQKQPHCNKATLNGPDSTRGYPCCCCCCCCCMLALTGRQCTSMPSFKRCSRSDSTMQRPCVARHNGFHSTNHLVMNCPFLTTNPMY
jgi:hypothetical protein